MRHCVSTKNLYPFPCIRDSERLHEEGWIQPLKLGCGYIYIFYLHASVQHRGVASFPRFPPARPIPQAAVSPIDLWEGPGPLSSLTNDQSIPSPRLCQSTALEAKLSSQAPQGFLTLSREWIIQAGTDVVSPRGTSMSWKLDRSSGTLSTQRTTLSAGTPRRNCTHRVRKYKGHLQYLFNQIPWLQYL